jgi:hypothetical protein
MSRMNGWSFFSNERNLEDYLAAHNEHLGDLVIRRQPRTPMNGQPDILSMKRRAILDTAEIKIGSTCEKTLGQLLDYAQWASQLTMEQVVGLAAEGRDPIDLPVAFEKRFGTPLPADLAGPPSLTLVASMFDRRTYHGIQYLKSQGVHIRALRYVETGRSIKVIPFTLEDLERQQRRRPDRRVTTPSGRRLVPALAPYKSHEDVQAFWAMFSRLFVWDFVPFSFIFELYEEWRRTETLEGWPRRTHQWGQFARQVKQLAVGSGQWTHHERFRAGSLMDTYEPLGDPLSAWRRPAPDHPVAGFLRQAARVS